MTESGTRARIVDHVAANPGVHFSELVRRLDLAPGQVQYHLRRVDDDRVVAADLFGRTHYYPPECDERERRRLAVLHRETARDVVLSLLRYGPQSPTRVAEDIGVARSTLEWHLDRLTTEDIVRKSRDERGHVTLVLAHPDETVPLLESVDPALSERLVDRFARLLDNLLAE